MECPQTTTPLSHRFSAESLLCERSEPGARTACSLDAGWTSVLLRRFNSEGRSVAFETVSTPDQTIVVHLAGLSEVQCFESGLWRTGVTQAGSAGMTPPGETSRLRVRTLRPDTTGDMVHLHVPQTFFDEAADQYRTAGSSRAVDRLNALAFVDPVVGKLVEAMAAASAAGANNLYAESAAQSLAVRLLSSQAWTRPLEDYRNPGPLSDRRLARAQEYMSANLSAAMSLGQIATEAGISKFHFVRLFHAATGSAPHAWLTRLRLATARRLLLTSDLGVEAISVHCGYAIARNFSTAFYRRYRQSPTKIRDTRAL